MDVFAYNRTAGSNVRVVAAYRPAPVSPPTKVVDPSNFVVLQSYASGRVLTAAPSVRDKSLLLLHGPPREAPLTTAQSRQLAYNSWMHAENWEPLAGDGFGGGSAPGQGGRQGAALTAYGEAYLKVPFFGRTSSEFTHQRTYVAWLGGAPFNANKIFQTDSWLVEVPPFIPAPTVVNAPPGSTIQGKSNVQWQTEVDDNWFSEHDWDSIKFQTPLLFRSNLGVTGVFQFGSSFFVTAFDDSST
jgi:hypothetical protein